MQREGARERQREIDREGEREREKERERQRERQREREKHRKKGETVLCSKVMMRQNIPFPNNYVIHIIYIWRACCYY